MIVIQRTASDNPGFRLLVAELDRYLAIRNGEANDFFAPFNQIDRIKHVVLAFENDGVTGCGAMKEYDTGCMEIKRMFVPVEQRGKGIATAVLTELETWARELGYHRCILETGDEMKEAIALYQKCRYSIIPNYGQYAQVTNSVCFEKRLI